MKRIFISIYLAICTCGCSQMDFGRPVVGTLSDVVDSGRPYVPERSQKDIALRAERLARILVAWETERGRSRQEYTIGVDDVLEVNVFALEVPGRMKTMSCTVGVDGTVDLPWIGDAGASGRTDKEVEDAVRRMYEGKFLKNPQVTVRVKEYRSAPVVLTGALKSPGVYYLRRNATTVLDILAQADGLDTSAGDELLIIRRREPDRDSEFPSTPGVPLPKPQQLINVDLKGLIDEGDLRLNLLVKKGDIISVPARIKEYIYVLGYVQRPGEFEVDRDRPVGALQAVARAGGLQPIARAENSFLIRQTAEGQLITPVDLTKVARGTRPRFYMRPGDTLVVGSSMVARLSEFIRPSVAAGVSYSPAP